jgi:hypothetical protein
MTKIKIPKPKPPTLIETNFGVIKKYGGAVGKQVTGFSVIRSFGDKNTATTHDGDKVERQEYFYCGGYGMVRTAPYELHFIYQDPRAMDNHPRKIIGRWQFMCTCGSLAAIVSYKELVGLVSPELGEYILVCNHHMSLKKNTGIGRHADNSTE